MSSKLSSPQDDITLADADMTPGLKEQIDEMVTRWADVTRGTREPSPFDGASSLKVNRKADVAYLVSALEGEGQRIEEGMRKSERVLANLRTHVEFLRSTHDIR